MLHVHHMCLFTDLVYNAAQLDSNSKFSTIELLIQLMAIVTMFPVTSFRTLLRKSLSCFCPSFPLLVATLAWVGQDTSVASSWSRRWRPRSCYSRVYNSSNHNVSSGNRSACLKADRTLVSLVGQPLSLTFLRRSTFPYRHAAHFHARRSPAHTVVWFRWSFHCHPLWIAFWHRLWLGQSLSCLLLWGRVCCRCPTISSLLW